MAVETETKPSPKELMEGRVHRIFLERGTLLSADNLSAIADMALKLDQTLSGNYPKNQALKSIYKGKEMVVDYTIEMVANMMLDKVQKSNPNANQIEPFFS